MENILQDIEFIEKDLIPEMVHNRCFCVPGSREFVEFESVLIQPVKTQKVNLNCVIYRAQVVVRFSGTATTFPVIIKLLPTDRESNDEAYGCFLNEEMFYNKMTSSYKLDIYPNCYVADMGRYGRPVVVLEDLEAIGYRPLDYELDEGHLSLLLEAIARFHGRGMKIKRDEFNTFREFYAKLVTKDSNDDDIRKINKVFRDIKENSNSQLARKWAEKIGDTLPVSDLQEDKFSTICHGDFNEAHWLFKYEDGRPVDVKIVGWNRMKYSCMIIDLDLVLIQKLLNTLSAIKVTEKFHEYFSLLAFDDDVQSRELLFREFLLRFFYPRAISNAQSPETEIELVNLLDQLP